MPSHLDIDPVALAAVLDELVYRQAREFAEAIVDDVRDNGPEGFDQGGGRATGLLKADMRIRSEEIDEHGIKITVGTDPANPDDGYQYAAAVHAGRAAIDSATVMRFYQEGGILRYTHHVGPAAMDPFLWNAVDRVNESSAFEVKWELRKSV